MSGPASKKVRLASPPPKRETRSSTSAQALPVPVASTSRPYDSDNMMDDDEPFEYDSDVEEAVGGTDEEDQDADSDGSKREVETIVIDDDSDEELQAPPEPLHKPFKGKLSSRKQYLADVEALAEELGSPNGVHVKNFQKQGDESVQFSLVHPAFRKGLKLVVMFPELAGYPHSHDVLCFSESEIGPDIEGVMGEVPSLPHELADRSVAGIIRYLVSRLVHNEPSPYASAAPRASQSQTQDDDEYDDGDDSLYGLGDAAISQSPEFMAALRSDFKDLLGAGFRPGFCRVSELDNIVSVSKKVNSLGVPLRALQAWDSDLITGEVRYLVLLMNFGAKYPVDPDNGTRGEVRFRVGISPHYKPSKAAIAAAFRSHSSNTYTKDDFDPISLSAPLDSLFSDKFQEILLTRRSNANVGWAGAEHHCLAPGKTKGTIDKKACQKADKEESTIAGAYTLPKDPMAKIGRKSSNYPLLAFSYLIRRFVMCPLFCLICFKKIQTNIVALKPFVCDSPLCLFQLISLGLGPSLEHEIKTNAPAVDLLIQLAYTAAKENGLKTDLQPEGLSLEVPLNPHAVWKKGDPTADFDGLDQAARNAGIANLITELPPVSEMKAWLQSEDLSENDRQLTRIRKLTDMRGGAISNSAWKLLRWIVASNTSYLKQIEEEDELVQGIPKSYRQFRLVVGSPAKEHLLTENIKAAQLKSNNAKTYPTLYAWHGSAVKNWHSILREGLHFKDTVNGRAYGHGVYFAKEGSISLGHYAQFATNSWKNADFGVGKLAALAEIVNLPKEFVSNNPYFVVQNLDWIQCRVLIVQRGASHNYTPDAAAEEAVAASRNQLTKSVPLDPAHPLLLNTTFVTIPDLLPKLQAMHQKLDDADEDLHTSDTELMKEPSITESPKKRALESTSSRADAAAAKAKAKDTFVPAGAELLKLIRLLPPPAKPNKGASLTIQREMRAMMAEEERLGPTECGFHFDPERSDGNIFTWIVELLGFDPDLPISKDLKEKGIQSLLMEIRFPESFPLSPPFFRIVYPRFLPFIHGGGGHVTGGGSICSDLLTTDGWNPIYSIPAVLLQIRMAISNLEPRPARLDPTHWARPYTMQEAIEGFKRAAATHGWTVPPELDALTRQY